MKKFLNNPWTISIGAGLIAGVLSTFIVDYFRKVSLASTFKEVIKFVWKCVVSFLTFDIKVWWILIGIVFFLFVLWFFEKYTEAKEEQTSFLKYNQDIFFGQWWKWSWQKNWDEKYEIRNLHPICNMCKTPLVPQYDYYNGLMCPRCNAVTQLNSNSERTIKVLICDNINKNAYPKENN